MAIDPMAIDRPSDDAGFRDLADRIDGLESRLSELSATLGGGNIFMTKGTLHVSGSAIFDGSLTIAKGLIGSEALKEQISVSETHGYTESWRPGSSWDSAVHVGVTKPDWATKAVVLVGGSISPDYDANSGSPYAYGRVACNGETSPSVMSLLGSTSVPVFCPKNVSYRNASLCGIGQSHRGERICVRSMYMDALRYNGIIIKDCPECSRIGVRLYITDKRIWCGECSSELTSYWRV